ncbi:MAG TPA: recombination mediator RecR [Dehalococcoidia bacterium]|nr:recombination mediator RecR [Dehalococcoidia bacterium]
MADLNTHSVPTAQPVARLIEEFHKLPGIGPKTAQRLTYFLIRMPHEEARALAEAILAVKDKIVLCSTCQNITDADPCIICRGDGRDLTKICVVAEPLDILPLERTREYKGLYHVLHGVISPMEGIGPDDLKIRELLSRLQDGVVTEVILATNPNLEGEATSMYLQRLISPLGIRVTRLARGLPFGADLEYADEVTLTRALENRQEI